MAAATASLVAAPVAVPLALEKSSFSGASVVSMPALRPAKAPRSFSVVASGTKKISTKTPLGPSGGIKFKDGKDAGGGAAKGKGVYQFTKKYGANVDGYSPIYAPEEWSASGDTYAGGAPGLALWALTLAGLLAVGAFLVYSTSALS